VVREKRKRRGEKRGGGRGEGQIREQKGGIFCEDFSVMRGTSEMLPKIFCSVHCCA
jgi:hypothetical protein